MQQAQAPLGGVFLLLLLSCGCGCRGGASSVRGCDADPGVVVLVPVLGRVVRAVVVMRYT